MPIFRFFFFLRVGDVLPSISFFVTPCWGCLRVCVRDFRLFYILSFHVCLIIDLLRDFVLKAATNIHTLAFALRRDCMVATSSSAFRSFSFPYPESQTVVPFQFRSCVFCDRKEPSDTQLFL